MRLIDADKLYPDRMTNKGNVAISQSQIAKAKTVDAIPLSVIDEIKAEIEQEYNRLRATRADETLELGECLGLKMSLKIIEQKVKEYER